MTPQQYCQQKTRESGSSFTLSFMFLPKDRRDAMTALYAFCREVDDVVDECTDYQIAQTKLAWWKQEIHRLFHETPQHPVTQALKPVVNTFHLQEAHFVEIIDGMQMDTQYNRYADFEQLALYCYRVASVVGLLSAQIFGYKDQATLEYAHDLGMAFQLTNIIRDVGEDARRGRIYIPLDELERAGVTEDQLLNSQASPQTQALLLKQIERAEMFYDKALSQLPKADTKPQLPGLMMAAIYRALLQEIKPDPNLVLTHKVVLPPFRKLKLALGAWFNYRKA
ncbi:presqualene diphosphate synthase HpnD [Methylophilus sp. UBA6697]|jgi:phytoene synthase|uniref:presqualene diphosphate synthase HpnD n=1 Tax=Methylophilus sp. UBA6697 TaxID=1946902 RepID=UPI000ED18A69|nr:presqualene diphosphate synthase HpnD [Methylophilus sp. UBA6697]HCU84829.1 squalene synthase HpnD [Methylophilus sp.]